MNLEDKNQEKIKYKELSLSEKMTFFLMPFEMGSRLFPAKEYPETEIERFKKFGFEQKLIQARKFKYYGFIFYLFLFLILLLSTS